MLCYTLSCSTMYIAVLPDNKIVTTVLEFILWIAKNVTKKLVPNNSHLQKIHSIQDQ